MKPLILVTGAAPGRQGATGNRVARQLIAAGFPVRALVRADDDRAESLRRLGIEVVVGDLLDIRGLRAAVAGVQRVYFSYPIQDRLLEAAVNLAAVSRDAGVEAILDLSMIPAAEGSPSPQARQHWLAERVLDWSGVGVVHLRAAFFYENLVRQCAESIREKGRIHFPFGQGAGKIAWIGANDVADASAAILAEAAPHLGETLLLTGPDALSVKEVAAVFSQVLGKPVEYADIPLERWQQELPKLESPNPHLIQHLSALSIGLKNNLGFGKATEVFRRLTGRSPRSLETFVQAHLESFGGISERDLT